MEEDRSYTQKEMQELFGWSPAWIRRIELLGLLPELDSEPQRGRKGRTYSSGDLYHIYWVSTLRHAGIELAEMKEYIEKANEFMALLEKYRADFGERIKVVFFHKPFNEDTFFIQPDNIPVDESVKIGRLAHWLEAKADNLNHKIRKWRNQMELILGQMDEIQKQAARSMESMSEIDHICIKNRLLALKPTK